MPLGGGNGATLPPIEGAGSGQVRERQKAYMAENHREAQRRSSTADLTDQDRLVHVERSAEGKTARSKILRQQAVSNSKEQFANSPDLGSEIAQHHHRCFGRALRISTPALNSKDVLRGLKDILLNHASLSERLREIEGVPERPPY